VSSELAPRLDRRHARRAETIEELLEVAVQVMAEHGVGGLSLGEVARRMGIRPPSLYVYFDSKNAVYDAVFARGWVDVVQSMENAMPEPEEWADLKAYLLEFARTFVRWNVEHPVQAQLMSWRPVPGYEPSAEAYESAIVAFQRGHGILARLQKLGLFRADAAVDELMRVWTVLTSGVVSQQLANAPHESFDEGAFTSLLPQIVAMYLAHYSPPKPTAPRGPNKKEGQHADQR
jgi:AcrR family transcriptional regulator